VCTCMCCTVLHCGALWCTVVHCGALWCTVVHCGALWCTVVHCGALRCTVVHCAAVCCSVLQCVVSVLKGRGGRKCANVCVAVCCTATRCNTLFHSRRRSDFKYLDLQISLGFQGSRLSDGDSVYTCENLFEILGTPVNFFESYGDSRENLFEILVIVNILSRISSGRGHG